ncbi:uncharacterized protein BDR25DRAFT_317121 [Lindgomyces ingoldianus]|uniref:Uncharacterized protein n=1 Tax=Lindgomyces ingoldianus TaxID=673940 RepID=A0ACB6QIM0_9PLEO|nr:uncharacterized protein BDR25DRAFT_317121 [Lindgomyces ingoldianus]KAF2466859.1 hypothetical protein BDR25DRAFT_317121 [Lindgomyces ingoldianus]
MPESKMLLTPAVAGVAGLVYVTSRITSPNLTASAFNSWYNNIHIPEILKSNTTSLVVRYKVIPQSTSSIPPWHYLALYKTSDVGSISNAAAQYLEAGMVEFHVDSWVPIQTFESLREKRGDVPKGRPKVQVPVKIEPATGEAGTQHVEEWYRKQHLDMFSMTPNYRRTTRYTSADGSIPKYLALHELDTDYMDPYQGDVLMGTEWATMVMKELLIFEPSKWEIIYEAGNVSEKL